jgi:hypothetical protein
MGAGKFLIAASGAKDFDVPFRHLKKYYFPDHVG